MTRETSIYVTTERAGFVVAGRRIPGEYRAAKEPDGAPILDGDGKPMKGFRPKLGFELELTAAEAEYELQQGTIAPKASGSARAKAAKSDSGSTPSSAA